MAAEIFYDADADLQLLENKKIAILGYGSQGHAHAQNLRDSGCQVIVGTRSEGPSYELAKSHGFNPLSLQQAAEEADIINLLLPDEKQGEVYERELRHVLKPGDVLMCSHGFNLHFGYVAAPDGVATLLVAPKGPGHLVRSEYLAGGGVPCLVAVGGEGDEATFQVGLAYASAIGGGRAGIIRTTIAEETETDLFGEQAVLCGGLSALIKAGFDTLVEAGYQPEMAYFECMHEVKLIVDLFYQGGLNYMRYSISNTAEYGDYTRGERIITEETRAEMKKILAEIKSGQFAREWIDESRSGAKRFESRRTAEHTHGVEKIGKELRRLMSWIEEKEV